MKLSRKTALISGGNKSIGKAIALGFAREGCHVFITYNRDPIAAQITLDELKQFNIQSDAFYLDLNQFQSIDHLIKELFHKTEKIDVLVNCAGILTRQPFLNVSTEELNAITQVNYLGPFYLIQQLAKHMIKQKIKGSIINIASISSKIASPNLTHYQCSKAAVSMLTKGAALELAPYGIRINTISPGLTETEINRNLWEPNSKTWQQRVRETPLGRAGQPEDHVAAAVYFASDDSEWTTGSNLAIDGGRSIT